MDRRGGLDMNSINFYRFGRRDFGIINMNKQSTPKEYGMQLQSNKNKKGKR